VEVVLMNAHQATVTLRRLRMYPTFDCVIDGVPYEVEVDYSPSEPHRGAELDIRSAKVGGHDVYDHLSKPARDSLEAQAWLRLEARARARI